MRIAAGLAIGMIACVTAAAMAQGGRTASGLATATGATGKVPFSISKETTAITRPLRADGTVDYVAAINEKYGAGITPENNGFVVWLELTGTGEGVLPSKTKAEFLRLCGAKEMRAGAEVWERYEAFMERTKGVKESAAVVDEMMAAGKWAWKEAEHPDMATFIKSRKKLQALAAQAAERPRWWMPLVSGDGRTLMATDVFSLGTFRDVARALSARAVLRGTNGDMDGFLADIKTLRQLARHIGSGPTLIERLVGVAVDALACNAVAGVAASGVLTEAQCKVVEAALNTMGRMPRMGEGIDVVERWIALDNVQWIAVGKGELLNLGVLEGSPDNPKFKSTMFREIDHNAMDWDVVFKRFNAAFDDYVKVMRLERLEDFRTQHATLDERMVNLKARMERGLTDFERDSEESRSEYSERVAGKLMAILFPNFGKAEELGRRADLWPEMTRVLLAAAEAKAKTGKWPARLEELTPEVLKGLPRDRYSAGEVKLFRYVLRAEGPRVYSVGANGRDDGGVLEGTEKDDLGVGAR